MNRIILIGNGFDLAHGLQTTYADFIDDLVNPMFKIVSDKNAPSGHSHNYFGNANDKLFFHRKENGKIDKWIGARQNPRINKKEFAANPDSASVLFKSFVEEKQRLGYWSDLESQYFKILYKNRGIPGNVKIINEEFEHLKSLLFDYLKNKIEEKLNDNIDFGPMLNHPIFRMIKFGHNNYTFDKNYFVSFNYTSRLLNQYYFSLSENEDNKKYPLSPINIHGDLDHNDNPIIFGYGDENSDAYKSIELLENDRLLKNFKTFQYLRSNRYMQILGLLEESEEIYVQIIGLSCGLSDKALLKTIFEHKNVKQIEATYYSDEGKYFENLYNISRIFDDNTLMRKKIISLEDTFKIG